MLIAVAVVSVYILVVLNFRMDIRSAYRVFQVRVYYILKSRLKGWYVGSERFKGLFNISCLTRCEIHVLSRSRIYPTIDCRTSADLSKSSLHHY